MAVARPTFSPSWCNAATGTNVDTLQLDDNEDLTWTPLITCPADFPIALVRSSLRPMHCLFARRPAHSLVHSLPVLTRRFTAHPSSRVQLHAHPPIRSHPRLHRGVPGPRSSPPKSTSRPEHTPQTPPTSPTRDPAIDGQVIALIGPYIMVRYLQRMGRSTSLSRSQKGMDATSLQSSIRPAGEDQQGKNLDNERHRNVDDIVETVKHDPYLEAHEQRLLGCIVDSGEQCRSYHVLLSVL